MERKRHQFTPEELDGPKGPSGYPIYIEKPHETHGEYVHNTKGEGAIARFKSLLRHKRHLRRMSVQNRSH